MRVQCFRNVLQVFAKIPAVMALAIIKNKVTLCCNLSILAENMMTCL